MALNSGACTSTMVPKTMDADAPRELLKRSGIVTEVVP